MVELRFEPRALWRTGIVPLCRVQRDEIDIPDLRRVVKITLQLRKVRAVVGDSGLVTAFDLMVPRRRKNVEVFVAPDFRLLLKDLPVCGIRADKRSIAGQKDGEGFLSSNLIHKKLPDFGIGVAHIAGIGKAAVSVGYEFHRFSGSNARNGEAWSDHGWNCRR